MLVIISSLNSVVFTSTSKISSISKTLHFTTQFFKTHSAMKNWDVTVFAERIRFQTKAKCFPNRTLHYKCNCAFINQSLYIVDIYRWIYVYKCCFLNLINEKNWTDTSNSWNLIYFSTKKVWTSDKMNCKNSFLTC